MQLMLAVLAMFVCGLNFSAEASEAPLLPDKVIRGNENFRFAKGGSTFNATCDDMILQISSGYGDGSKTTISPVGATLNGQPIELAPAIKAKLGLSKGFYKYMAFCTSKDDISVAFYWISAWDKKIEYRSGTFTVSRGGGTILNSEETVAPSDFWPE